MCNTRPRPEPSILKTTAEGWLGKAGVLLLVLVSFSFSPSKGMVLPSVMVGSEGCGARIVGAKDGVHILEAFHVSNERLLLWLLGLNTVDGAPERRAKAKIFMCSSQSS